jgi:hypothetical protein
MAGGTVTAAAGMTTYPPYFKAWDDLFAAQGSNATPADENQAVSLPAEDSVCFPMLYPPYINYASMWGSLSSTGGSGKLRPCFLETYSAARGDFSPCGGDYMAGDNFSDMA